MVDNNTEQVELEVADVEKIWCLFNERLRKRLAQKAISEKIGLPVPLVRAVLHGHYVFKDGRVVVDMPAMPPTKSRLPCRTLRRPRW